MEHNKKRPLDDENDDVRPDDTKKSKVAHDPPTTSQAAAHQEIETVGMGDLCDDVIMHIFKFLTNDSLAAMSL